MFNKKAIAVFAIASELVLVKVIGTKIKNTIDAQPLESYGTTAGEFYNKIIAGEEVSKIK